MTRTNWANVLTWSRLVLLLPITIAAFLQSRIVVLVLFCIAELTDFLDGFIARKTGMGSEKGALLDSRVDNCMLVALLLWLWLLFPVLVREEIALLGIMLILLLLQLVVARIKLNKWTGLHLLSDKVSAIIGAAALVALFAIGDVPWTRTLFTIALIGGIIAMTEGCLYLLKGGKNLDARFFWDP